MKTDLQFLPSAKMWTDQGAMGGAVLFPTMICHVSFTDSATQQSSSLRLCGGYKDQQNSLYAQVINKLVGKLEGV